MFRPEFEFVKQRKLRILVLEDEDKDFFLRWWFVIKRFALATGAKCEVYWQRTPEDLLLPPGQRKQMVWDSDPRNVRSCEILPTKSQIPPNAENDLSIGAHRPYSDFDFYFFDQNMGSNEVVGKGTDWAWHSSKGGAAYKKYIAKCRGLSEDDCRFYIWTTYDADDFREVEKENLGPKDPSWPESFAEPESFPVQAILRWFDKSYPSACDKVIVWTQFIGRLDSVNELDAFLAYDPKHICYVRSEFPPLEDIDRFRYVRGVILLFRELSPSNCKRLFDFSRRVLAPIVVFVESGAPVSVGAAEKSGIILRSFRDGELRDLSIALGALLRCDPLAGMCESSSPMRLFLDDVISRAHREGAIEIAGEPGTGRNYLRRLVENIPVREPIIDVFEGSSRKASGSGEGNEVISEELSGYKRTEMILSSTSMRRVRDIACKAAASEKATVLLVGESGTGKEVIARLIRDRSPRKDKPFVPVNLAAFAPGLVESELFGHIKGAFPGAHTDRIGYLESGNTGTVFLDEITEIPLEIQIKLLRFLEERKIQRVGTTDDISLDIRVIAATNQPIQELVSQGKFRKDLFYRLNGVRINIPPLRERTEEIPLLADYFLSEFCSREKQQPKRIGPDAMDLLLHYGWPGNIRELLNAVEAACVLSDEGMIEKKDFVNVISSEYEQEFLDAGKPSPFNMSLQWIPTSGRLSSACVSCCKRACL